MRRSQKSAKKLTKTRFWISKLFKVNASFFTISRLISYEGRSKFLQVDMLN